MKKTTATLITLIATLATSNAFGDPQLNCKVTESHDFSKPGVTTEYSTQLVDSMARMVLGQAGDFTVIATAIADENNLSTGVISVLAKLQSGFQIQGNGKSFLINNVSKQESFVYNCRLIK